MYNDDKGVNDDDASVTYNNYLLQTCQNFLGAWGLINVELQPWRLGPPSHRLLCQVVQTPGLAGEQLRVST